ncbi:hypothetical protein PFFVO_00608 [Plasmodium falciparum Vietnam Oak-Knoll (FVO)]|uniref:Uncharacterized protein n=1 Tax=Plasmodium falciparum Vietnam Oak-Knoll (FVO) TaxID=1036723 RepID=A0A024VCK9_PLAFA|nr:hypothetical protein PFFVO_00608 [Plasmodium falciparum Vietnam Oak-Knoll (FVO)]
MFIKSRIINFYKNNPFAFCLGSTWFLLINGGILFSYKYFKNFEHRHCYINDSINILKIYINYKKGDNLKLLRRKGNIDSSNERAKCELIFSYNDEKIYLNVNAIRINKKKNNKNYNDNNDDNNDNNDDDDDDDDENRDISIYLENPFLIKKDIKKYFLKVKLFLYSFVTTTMEDQISQENYEHENKMKNNIKENNNLILSDDIKNKNEKIYDIIKGASVWKINNLMVVKKKKKKIINNDNIKGDVLQSDDIKGDILQSDSICPSSTNNINSVGYNSVINSFLFYIRSFFNNNFYYVYEIYPIYGNVKDNSYYCKYDNKRKTLNDTQRNLSQIMLCAFFISTMLAIKRIYIYKNSYSSLNFVKNFVLHNEHLHNILGHKQVQILSISGIHEKNYLNSKIFFQGKEKQGVIQMTATRNSSDTSFFLLHAKLLLNNEMIELKKEI